MGITCSRMLRRFRRSCSSEISSSRSLKTINYAVVPWTTFCDPEVARCGLTEAEAREKYGDVDVFTLDQGDVDRAVAEGETHGFSKVIASRWTGKILGVHLVGANAGGGHP